MEDNNLFNRDWGVGPLSAWKLAGQVTSVYRLLKHRERIGGVWTRNEVSTASPVSVEVHPSNRCNLGCVFCSWREHRHAEELTSASFRRLIDDLIDLSSKSVVFSGGGEPSLHPYLPTAIKRLSRAGIEVGVISNGLAMNRVLFEGYLSCTWVKFSLSVPTPELYGSLISPGKPQHFFRVLNNLNRLAQAKGRSHQALPTLGISVMVMRETQDGATILKALDLAADYGADYVMFRPLRGCEEHRVTRPLDELRGLAHIATDRATVLGIGQQFGGYAQEYASIAHQPPAVEGPACPVVQEGLIALVAASGLVFPCYALAKAGATNMHFGNVATHSFNEIWLGEARVKSVLRIDARKCPDCRLRGHNAFLRRMPDLADAMDEVAATEEDRHFNFL